MKMMPTAISATNQNKIEFAFKSLF